MTAPEAMVIMFRKMHFHLTGSTTDVIPAEKYFQRAMNTYTDKNAQARCLFMMAKCAAKKK